MVVHMDYMIYVHIIENPKSNGGFHKWGYPQIDGSYGEIPLKWMMEWGTPILRNLHMLISYDQKSILYTLY